MANQIYHEEVPLLAPADKADKAQMKQMLLTHKNKLQKLHNEYGIRQHSLKQLALSRNIQLKTSNTTSTILYRDILALKKSRDRLKKL